MCEHEIREAVALYRAYFEKAGVAKKRRTEVRPPWFEDDFVLDCRNMLVGVEKMLAAGWTDHATNWLGFMQTCLYNKGAPSLHELKTNNCDRG